MEGAPSEISGSEGAAFIAAASSGSMSVAIVCTFPKAAERDGYGCIQAYGGIYAIALKL